MPRVTTSSLVEEQRRYWDAEYRRRPDMFGPSPSHAAVYAAERFRTIHARTVLELGAGRGRDTVWFARNGFSVTAMDFSVSGLARLRESANVAGYGGNVRILSRDVRDPLPFDDGEVDAVYAHMLLCMALTTDEILAVVAEVARVLKPGGTFIYTVRHTADSYYGAGTAHGDGIYQYGGVAVHFFDRALVRQVAEGWLLYGVYPFEEDEPPRRLWRITQTTRPH